jgi:archaellum component FlaF (FlaF/FlaG flagellin family)
MLHDLSHLGRDGGRVGGSEDPIAPPGTNYAITVDWAGKGTGAQLTPGMDMTFAWEPAPVGSLVRLEVFRNNAHHETTLLNYAADAGAYAWTVPSDIELHDADYFQAKLTIVDGAIQTTILAERYSPPFQVVRRGNGLTDVTVNARHISITLTDDGSLVDGDRVDVFLNGAKVIDNHTLVGSAGTVFSLDLLSGSNELRVMALNEGTSSPNTAQLRLSDVTVGAAVQSWRLLAGESGSLLIYAARP